MKITICIERNFEISALIIMNARKISRQQQMLASDF